MRKVASTSLCIGALGAALGCGAIAEPGDRGRPLLSLDQRIVGVAPGTDYTSLRAAFFWTSDPLRGLLPAGAVLRTGQGVIEAISQDVPVTAGLSLRFSLPLYDLPPLAALAREPPIALGALLIYDDRNGNQQLDLLARDAPAPIDAILGPVENYRVLFLGEGTLEASDLQLDAPGFYVLRAGQPLDAAGAGLGHLVPHNAALDITLREDPEKQVWMCTEEPSATSSETTDAGQVDPSQVPGDALVECSADRRALSYQRTRRTAASICADYSVKIEQGRAALAPGAPVPADWPCR